MKHATLLGAILLASTSLVAQGNVYSPSELGLGEGSGYSYAGFGRFSDMRFQQVNNDLGTTAHVLKGFSLRLDNRSYSTTSSGGGRTWSNVTINCSDGDINNFTNTYASNSTSTPVMVFSGSVTWATQSGYPSTSPAAWGSNGHSFPFGTGGTSSIFLYTGTADLLVDTVFTGGVLANGYTTWSTSSSSSNYYYLDNENKPSPTSSASGAGRYVPATRLNGMGTCNDSGMTTSTGSYLYAVCTAYGPAYSVINYRDNLLFYAYSYYTAYDAPVLHAIGFNTLETGVDLGTGCNRLHAGGPLIIYGLQTLKKEYNASGYSGYQFLLTKAKPSYVGLKAIVQAAWTDSVTNKLQLSQAYERAIPGPISPNGPPFLTTVGYSTTSATANYGPYNYFYYAVGYCFAK